MPREGFEVVENYEIDVAICDTHFIGNSDPQGQSEKGRSALVRPNKVYLLNLLFINNENYECSRKKGFHS